MHETINDVRRDYGWSIVDLAKNLGMPYRTAQNYCSGERKPPEWVTKLVCEEIRRQAEAEMRAK